MHQMGLRIRCVADRGAVRQRQTHILGRVLISTGGDLRVRVEHDVLEAACGLDRHY